MNLEHLTHQVAAIARRAGAFMLKERQHFSLDHVEHKRGENYNLVSYVDKETELMLVEALHQLLPEAGFITEEGMVEQAAEDGLLWIIDPLDGTVNFTHGFPEYCTSIGLVRGGKVLSGVIYKPQHDELYWSYKGGGAWCNHEQLKISPVRGLSDSLIASGFPHTREHKTEAYLRVIHHAVEHTHGFRRIGSAALDLAYVARGWVEAYFEYNLAAWDIAAGILMVQEAGGQVTDFSGGENYLFGREILATNGHIHAELQTLIARDWPKVQQA